MSIHASVANGLLIFSTDATPTTTSTTVSPNPGNGTTLEDYEISPGLVGFLVTFGVAVSLFVLLVFMTRRLRRVKHAGNANQRVTATFDGVGPKLASHEVSQPEVAGSAAAKTEQS